MTAEPGWNEYADPDFAPGMVVAAADRDRDDLRTWGVVQTEHRLIFGEMWHWEAWVPRTHLPERLVVVGDDGRAIDA